MDHMDYEKLGAFYLGKDYDLEAKKQEESLLLYDSKDLVTHAMCVGMTGSGKTGLCVTLIEEAAIDQVPAIIVDPKGDLANLLLTFPELRPDDFRPWINEDDARRKDLSPEEYAGKQADLWRNGLASYGQTGERIRKLRDAADFVIYTPGSEAGMPVSILSSFGAPPRQVLEDGDLLRDRISSTATSLLGLLGVDADPIQSREHILLSTLLDHLWRQGKPVDLGSLIQSVQEPPVDRVGVMELESFFPSKDRFKLAMRINNLLAAPGFQGWLSGQPLEIGDILHTETGKPRVAIFSLAHLQESERMFFVSLLLNQTLAWMRSRPGTTSLRALLYMDEIFGYMPPVAEPPSKRPLLTLLKQARAYGLGVVLATQNPVDLDYKGLSNTGTWFIGRLQTERDKERLLDGLEGIGDGAFERADMENVISSLGKRVFLLHNVHEDGPSLFHTRWAMSYLRGPLTRGQIKTLMDERRAGADHRSADAAGQASSASPGASALPAAAVSEAVPKPPAVPAVPTAASRPVLPAGIRQYFSGAGTEYTPYLLGLGRVRYADSKKNIIHSEDVALALPLFEEMIDVDWEEAEASEIDERDLRTEAPDTGSFDSLPDAASKAASYKSWKKELSNHLYRSRSLDLRTSDAFGLTSEPGESERDFRIRLGEAAREKRDVEKDKLRAKYETKKDRLDERLRKARQRLEVEKEQAKGQKLEAALSVGSTLLSVFTGRKKLSYTNLSRARTAAGRFGRSAKEKADVDRAEENIEAITEQIEELNDELQTALEALDDRYDPLTEELGTKSVRPRRADVDVKLTALLWLGE